MQAESCISMATHRPNVAVRLVSRAISGGYSSGVKAISSMSCPAA